MPADIVQEKSIRRAELREEPVDGAANRPLTRLGSPYSLAFADLQGELARVHAAQRGGDDVIDAVALSTEDDARFEGAAGFVVRRAFGSNQRATGFIPVACWAASHTTGTSPLA